MPVIDPVLLQQAKANPDTQFPVLVVLKEDCPLPHSLTGKGRFIMENKIYSATISGKLLLELDSHADLEAVELDGEVWIS